MFFYKIYDLLFCIKTRTESFNKNWSFIAKNFSTLHQTKESVAEPRKTILQLAIMGKLAPQDPTNEPASELLKKIKQEKTKLEAECKIKKQKPLSTITEKEKPFHLPQGWEWVRLGEVILSITNGGTPSKNNLSYWNGKIPWASVKDMNVDLYLNTTRYFITEAGLTNSSTNIIKEWHIILCTRMGLDKIAINNIDVTINQDLKAIQLAMYIFIVFC